MVTSRRCCIPTDTAPYLDRLLKHYLRKGIIEEKWIPQIKSELTEKGKVLIPERDEDGKVIKVYPVTEKPVAYFVREGEPNPHKGLCLWMPEAFFEKNGRDGLPLDL